MTLPIKGEEYKETMSIPRPWWEGGGDIGVKLRNEKTDKLNLTVFAMIAPKGRNTKSQGNALMFIHIFYLSVFPVALVQRISRPMQSPPSAVDQPTWFWGLVGHRICDLGILPSWQPLW